MRNYRVFLNPKDRIEDKKSKEEKEGNVAEKRKIFEENKNEPKQETFWEKRKKLTKPERNKKFECKSKNQHQMLT